MLKELLVNYKEILIINLTFIGTILAIFFTLITLPIQNILGRYSQDLVNRVKKDWVFVISFLLLILFFMYNLILLATPINFQLILWSLESGLASVLFLLILVMRAFYLLDIRNQIRDIAHNFKNQISPTIKKSAAQRKKEIRKIELPISPEFKDTIAEFQVIEPVIEWLKSKTEVIIDVIQQATRENRFEIVESGLKNLCEITKEYISARRDYSTEHDLFLIYILERIIDTKNLISTSSHPKIMISILNTCATIARDSFIIKPIRAELGENFIPLGYIDLLKEIALSNEILRETSYAPATACRKLMEVGKSAIDFEYPRTAGVVVERLGQISQQATKLHTLYADYVANMANSGICQLFYYSFMNLGKIRVNREYILVSMADEINKSIQIYFEDNFEYTMRSNIAPIIGLMANNGLAKIFVSAIHQNAKNSTDTLDILQILEHFLDGLNKNMIVGMNRGKYFDVRDIYSHIYAISISLFYYIGKDINQDAEIRNSILSIIEDQIFHIVFNPIKMSLKRISNTVIPLSDYFNNFASILGIMFAKNEQGHFNRIVEIWINAVIAYIDEKKNDIYLAENKDMLNHNVVHTISLLYQYLRLFGVWSYKWNKSQLLTGIKNALKDQPEVTFVKESWGFNMSSTIVYYPRTALSRAWSVERPILPYDANYFANLDKELIDKESIDKYEIFLKNAE
ncbi:hypothetical protein ES705_08107 [subsurface metagenome]